MMQDLTFDEIQFVSGGDALSAADGAQIGGVVGGAAGLGAYMTGAAGSLGVGDAIALGAAFGGIAGIGAVVIVAGGIALYHYTHAAK